MAKKQACGNCGKSGGCGCQTTNPYEASVKAVWHEPADYNMLQHGPAFFPGMKLSSTQKKEVKAFVNRRAFEDVPVSDGWTEAKKLLATLRAASFIHQTNHWQTLGPTFYADHLLFQRLYDETQKGIDELAERLVGSGVGVAAQSQAAAVHVLVDEMFKLDTVSIGTSMTAESWVLRSIERTIKALEVDGNLSPGTSNLLEGLYDIHEGFMYLLTQRVVPAIEQ